MADKRIRFGEFYIPVINGLEYLTDESRSETDFLFINGPGDSFSMYFEKDFPVFEIPKGKCRDYGLFEINRQNKRIKFFCPEKRESLRYAVWYFYVEYYSDGGESKILPGQVRVSFDMTSLIQSRDRPGFIEVLEQIAPLQPVKS